MQGIPWFRLVIFLVVVNVISLSVHAFAGFRLTSVMPPGSVGARSVWILLGLLFLTLNAGMFLSRMAHPPLWARTVTVTGFVWMGVVFLILSTGFGADLLSGVIRFIGWLSGRDFSSLLWWNRVGFLLVVPFATLYGTFQALRPPQIHEVEIRIPNLAKEWEGVRIAHLTDTHVGPILGRSWVEDLVRRVDSAKPDIVVHTGDLVDGSVESLRDALEPLSRLRGREGTFFVTGNHEGYSGIKPWSQQMRLWGWDVLANERRILSRKDAQLVMAGVTDAHEGGIRGGLAPDVGSALAGIPPDVPVILLAHQPKQAIQAQGHRVSLQLSGHTHGGQIWPFHYLVRLQQPMNAGLERIGDVLVFTSRGAGFWGPPLRIGSPAEVPILVLRKG